MSGGQTGVDRAALDAALATGLEIGGWCPRARRAEDGAIPERYPLRETASSSYAVRTEWNVRDSDGTLVLVLKCDDVSRGTQLTIESARKQGKPLFVHGLATSRRSVSTAAEKSIADAISQVVDWIDAHNIRVLNVAGPRGSSSRQVYSKAHAFMTRLIERLMADRKPVRAPRSAARRGK